jgi:hypothetical protein
MSSKKKEAMNKATKTHASITPAHHSRGCLRYPGSDEKGDVIDHSTYKKIIKNCGLYWEREHLGLRLPDKFLIKGFIERILDIFPVIKGYYSSSLNTSQPQSSLSNRG